jgi:TetR/AcrR family transcriptional regulator
MSAQADHGVGGRESEPVTARADRRRKQILAAARTLVSQKGFDACRMDDVAAAVGVTKPAVYRYFPSKDLLIQALLNEDVIGPTSTLLAEIAAHQGPLRELLLTFAHRTVAIQEGGLAAGYMVLALDQAERRPEIARTLRSQVMAPGLLALGQAFETAMERGELKAGGDLVMMVRLFFAPFIQLSLIRGGVGVPMSGPEEQSRYLTFHVDAFLRAFRT